jgi:hypothetical protein
MNSRQGRTHRIMQAVMLGVICATPALPVLAQIVKRGETELDKLVMSSRELRVSQTLIYADALKKPPGYANAIDAFRSEYGRSWRFLIDERVGRPNLVEGGAIPFIPGPANKLQWKDFGADCDRPSCVPRAKIETQARDFLTRNRAAFQINPEQLVLDPVGTVPVGNSVYFVRFQWVYGGLPVEGGSVFLAINNGNLIQVGITKRVLNS